MEPTPAQRESTDGAGRENTGAEHRVQPHDGAGLPHVIYLPGMQGEMPGDRWFVSGLRDGGIRAATIFNWTQRQWPVQNLRDRDQHHRAAEALIEMIDAADPGPVVLIGHSTGAMVILDALSTLSRPRVEQAWLLSAAVSHAYDLRPALAGVHRLISIYSPADYVVLNLGTRVFGSADGLTQPCGGYQPFDGPGSDDARVEQIKWDPAWLRSGHYGGHLGPMAAASGAFARDIMAPMICARLRTEPSA